LESLPLKKGDLRGFENLQAEGINGKRYKPKNQSVIPAAFEWEVRHGQHK